MVILNHVSFLQAYILRLNRISVQSTWESIQLFSVTSKFVYLPSELFRKLVYAQQNLVGGSWEGMLSSFRDLISVLYTEWEDYLMQSLHPSERTYFESVRDNTITEDDLMRSLFKLSYVLAKKSGQEVIVLIDEYEAPITRAYSGNYFGKVYSLYPSL